MTAIRKMNR